MSQLLLYGSEVFDLPKNDVTQLSNISGLTFIENYINDKEHDLLLFSINAEPWLTDLKRRVQHYGYKYDYKRRSIDYGMYLGDLPLWSKAFCERLVSDHLINESPDQIIVNEYEPGQGIANHIDCEPCFKDTIISLSLCSGCIMELINVSTHEKVEMFLPPKSLIVLNGEARYKWSHGIPARRVDVFNDVRRERSKRVSLTFRKVILGQQK